MSRRSSQSYGQPNGQGYGQPSARSYGPGSGQGYGQAAPQPFALLNDEPVADPTEDLLGARRAAAQLTALLVGSRGATPFTLAVDAGWGMGKSSLMRLVDTQLRVFPGVHTVWYNAWTSSGPDALEGLIKSVLGRFDPRLLRRWARRLREHRPLVGVLRAATLAAAGPLGMSAAVNELWSALSADAGARNTMREALRVLVAEWAATGAAGSGDGRMLVVFIDDLDRCSEETFLAVCEAVKVYLDVPGLAFVIGCDRAAIGPGGLLPNLSPTGAAFVEKIFQTTYRIPPPGAADLRGYVLSCARSAGIAHLLDDALVQLIAQRAARNPRRVKRLLNGLLLEAALNPVWAGARLEAVIRTLLLQYLYPEFYRLMTVPAGWGDGDVVADFRMYRLIRAQCVLGTPPPAGGDGFLLAHDVAPGAVRTHPARALADLEQRLPAAFPAFAADPAFTTLVDELTALPEADRILRGLREGAEPDRDAPWLLDPAAAAWLPPGPGDTPWPGPGRDQGRVPFPTSPGPAREPYPTPSGPRPGTDTIPSFPSPPEQPSPWPVPWPDSGPGPWSSPYPQQPSPYADPGYSPLRRAAEDPGVPEPTVGDALWPPEPDGRDRSEREGGSPLPRSADDRGVPEPTVTRPVLRGTEEPGETGESADEGDWPAPMPVGDRGVPESEGRPRPVLRKPEEARADSGDPEPVSAARTSRPAGDEGADPAPWSPPPQQAGPPPPDADAAEPAARAAEDDDLRADGRTSATGVWWEAERLPAEPIRPRDLAEADADVAEADEGEAVPVPVPAETGAPAGRPAADSAAPGGPVPVTGRAADAEPAEPAAPAADPVPGQPAPAVPSPPARSDRLDPAQPGRPDPALPGRPTGPYGPDPAVPDRPDPAVASRPARPDPAGTPSPRASEGFPQWAGGQQGGATGVGEGARAVPPGPRADGRRGRKSRPDTRARREAIAAAQARRDATPPGPADPDTRYSYSSGQGQPAAPSSVPDSVPPAASGGWVPVADGGGRRVQGTVVVCGWRGQPAAVLTAQLAALGVRTAAVETAADLAGMPVPDGPPYVLVASGVSGGDADRLARFAARLRVRQGARDDVPVVVYAPYRTPLDELAARRLGAVLVVDPRELVARVTAALSADGAAPSDLPGRPYGDRRG